MLHVYGIVKDRVSSSAGKRDFLLLLAAPLYITLLCQKYGNSLRCLCLVFSCVASTYHYHRMLANWQHHSLYADMSVERGEVMLPQDYHKQACRFFVRILQRLEERDVRNGKDHSPH